MQLTRSERKRAREIEAEWDSYQADLRRRGIDMADPKALQAENESLRQRLAALEAEKATQAKAGIVCKVSDKGAVSVYGLQRFPVTLYAEQWTKLIGEMPTITAFIAANKARLAFKDREKQTTAPTATAQPTA